MTDATTTTTAENATNRQPRLHLTVGVTGHRVLADAPGVEHALERVLDIVYGELRVDPACTDVVVLSALAEGADRLVPKVLLAQLGEHAHLHAVLPLGVDEYARDFATKRSQDEFMTLYNLARTKTVPEHNLPRAKAYDAVGKYIVDHCDVLIAVWDGRGARGRGGTGAVVKRARQQLVPVVWIDVAQPHKIAMLSTRQREGWRSEGWQLDLPPIADVGDGAVLVAHQATVREWTPRTHADLQELVSPFIRWAAPPYAAVSERARQYRSRYMHASRLILALPTVAVILATLQVLFWSEVKWIPFVEAGLLGAQWVVLRYSRRLRVHRHWISYRALAERLRCAFFVAVAGGRGVHDVLLVDPKTEDLSDQSTAGYLAEVLKSKPPLHRGTESAATVREYLIEHWIDDQIAYHGKVRGKHRRLETVASWTITISVVVALLAAVVHALLKHEEVGSGFTWGALLIFFAIAVPAFGGMVHGFEAQREYKRHAERYARMLKVLRALRMEMRAAVTYEAVASVAAKVEAVVCDENSDWFGVMRFHDVEPVP